MDKSNLKKIAEEINKLLIPILGQYGGKFKPAELPVATETNTDGWDVELARYPYSKNAPMKFSLELWFDKFTAYKRGKLWYGFFSNNKKTIENISKQHLPQYLLLDSDYNLIYAKDIKWSSKDGNIKLKKKLERRKFDIPTIELHSSKQFFYGIYEYANIDLSKAGIEKLAKRAINFYNAVLESGIVTEKHSNSRIYSKVENSTKVVSHILRERDPYLATLRKQTDNYVCQICYIKMEDIYGDLGKYSAEAHHIIPLSKLKSQTRTMVSDLITVCPNCHTVLHSMKGEKADIPKLRAIVKKRRK